MAKMYEVGYRINALARLCKVVEAENEKEAKAAAKEYFIGVFGKDRINETYKGKNVVCREIKEPIITEDHQEV